MEFFCLPEIWGVFMHPSTLPTIELATRDLAFPKLSNLTRSESNSFQNSHNYVVFISFFVSSFLLNCFYYFCKDIIIKVFWYMIRMIVWLKHDGGK